MLACVEPSDRLVRQSMEIMIDRATSWLILSRAICTSGFSGTLQLGFLQDENPSQLHGTSSDWLRLGPWGPIVIRSHQFVVNNRAGEGRRCSPDAACRRPRGRLHRSCLERPFRQKVLQSAGRLSSDQPTMRPKVLRKAARKTRKSIPFTRCEWHVLSSRQWACRRRKGGAIRVHAL